MSFSGSPVCGADRITKAMPPRSWQGHSALPVFDPTHKRYSEALRYRALRQLRPGQRDHRHRPRAGRPEAAVGGARGRRDHVANPLIDVIPIQRREADARSFTQFDMGACETLGYSNGLPRLRPSRLDDALENSTQRQARAGDRVARLDDATTYGLLSRGETLGVFQLDGAQCAICCGAWAPPRSTTSRPSVRCTGPARGANAHNDYADRRTPAKRSHRSTRTAEPLKDILGETYA